MKRKDVRPITNSEDYKKVLRYLKTATKYGMRDYMIFRLGMTCVLRISDLVYLKYSDVFTDTGKVRKKLCLKEIKTGKTKEILLTHVKKDLYDYKLFMQNNFNFKDLPDKYWNTPLKSQELETKGTRKNADKVKKHANDWLFPSSQHPTEHISIKTFYKAMMNASKATGVEHLGTHTARKTGAYLLYRGNFDDVLKAKDLQPNNNIGLAMKVLNHSSASATLSYIGLEQDSIDKQVKENSAFDIEI